MTLIGLIYADYFQSKIWNVYDHGKFFYFIM
jgi:hypothetical protein